MFNICFEMSKYFYSLNIVIILSLFFNICYCVSIENKYLIYNVNELEGFSLKRDVYCRIANIIKHLNR